MTKLNDIQNIKTENYPPAVREVEWTHQEIMELLRSMVGQMVYSIKHYSPVRILGVIDEETFVIAGSFGKTQADIHHIRTLEYIGQESFNLTV